MNDECSLRLCLGKYLSASFNNAHIFIWIFYWICCHMQTRIESVKCIWAEKRLLSIAETWLIELMRGSDKAKPIDEFQIWKECQSSQKHYRRLKFTINKKEFFKHFSNLMPSSTRRRPRTFSKARPNIEEWKKTRSRARYSTNRGTFVKKLGCCVGGEYYNIIWFYQLDW